LVEPLFVAGNGGEKMGSSRQLGQPAEKGCAYARGATLLLSSREIRHADALHQAFAGTTAAPWPKVDRFGRPTGTLDWLASMTTISIY
jgi:hypothetical protein